MLGPALKGARRGFGATGQGRRRAARRCGPGSPPPGLGAAAFPAAPPCQGTSLPNGGGAGWKPPRRRLAAAMGPGRAAGRPADTGGAALPAGEALAARPAPDAALAARPARPRRSRLLLPRPFPSSPFSPLLSSPCRSRSAPHGPGTALGRAGQSRARLRGGLGAGSPHRELRPPAGWHAGGN